MKTCLTWHSLFLSEYDCNSYSHTDKSSLDTRDLKISFRGKWCLIIVRQWWKCKPISKKKEGNLLLVYLFMKRQFSQMSEHYALWNWLWECRDS